MIEPAVERGLVDVDTCIDEQLLDMREGAQRLLAAGAGVDAQGAKSGDAQMLALDFRVEHAACLVGLGRIAIQEHETRRELRRELDLRLLGNRSQESRGILMSRPQPSPVLPSVAMAPRCVRRFSELMAVCTTQWLG